MIPELAPGAWASGQVHCLSIISCLVQGGDHLCPARCRSVRHMLQRQKPEGHGGARIDPQGGLQARQGNCQFCEVICRMTHLPKHQTAEAHLGHFCACVVHGKSCMYYRSPARHAEAMHLNLGARVVNACRLQFDLNTATPLVPRNRVNGLTDGQRCFDSTEPVPCNRSL